MHDRFSIKRLSRRQFIMMGISFFGSLYFQRAISGHSGKAGVHELSDGFYAINGWVVKRDDLT